MKLKNGMEKTEKVDFSRQFRNNPDEWKWSNDVKEEHFEIKTVHVH